MVLKLHIILWTAGTVSGLHLTEGFIMEGGKEEVALCVVSYDVPNMS